MAQLTATTGFPQASELAVQTALPFVGSLSREDLQTVLGLIEDDVLKLYEDRNVQLTDGGTVTYSATTVSFTESLNLHINSKEAGGAPIIVDLGSTTRTVSADGRMIYATVNRSAGTAVITDDAATLPAVDSSNKEIFLLAKRIDDGAGNKRLYWRSGAVFEDGQASKLGSLWGGTANNTNKITIPSDTKTNLDALTRVAGVLLYASDENKVYYDNGSTLVELGAAGASGMFDDSSNSSGSKTVTGTERAGVSAFTIDNGDTYTINTGGRLLVDESLTVDGTLTVNGDCQFIAENITDEDLGSKIYSTTATSGGTNDLFISSANGFTITTVRDSWFRPFELSDGSWLVEFSMDVEGNNVTTGSVGINGITTISSTMRQHVSASSGDGATMSINAYAAPSTSSSTALIFLDASSSEDRYLIYGTIRLQNKPNWAT